jgi:hypothetical protein
MEVIKKMKQKMEKGEGGRKKEKVNACGII